MSFPRTENHAVHVAVPGPFTQALCSALKRTSDVGDDSKADLKSRTFDVRPSSQQRTFSKAMVTSALCQKRK